MIQTGAGSFGNGSLNGNAIFRFEGADPSSSYAWVDIGAGRISSSGNGTVTTILDETTGSSGTVTNDQTISGGPFSVKSNGMGTLSFGTTRNFSVAMFGTNKGFLLGGNAITGDVNVARGRFEDQTLTGFTSSTLSGRFIGGDAPPPTINGGDDIFIFQIAFPNITGTGDNSSGSGLSTNVPFSATFTSPDSSGRILVTVSAGSGGGTAATWIISGSASVVVPLGDHHAKILFLDQ